MRWLIVGALVVLCVVYTQAADAPTLQAPTWMIGDTWTYQTPTGSQIVYTVLGASENGYTVRSQIGSTPTSVFLIHPNLSTDEGYFIQLRWPLALGQSWSADEVGQANNGTNNANWHTTWVVKAWESVAVPAGTFDAYRIDGQQCAEVATHQCGDFSFWYAPSAKSFVKEAWAAVPYWGDPQNTKSPGLAGRAEELVSYTLHSP